MVLFIGLEVVGISIMFQVVVILKCVYLEFGGKLLFIVCVDVDVQVVVFVVVVGLMVNVGQGCVLLICFLVYNLLCVVFVQCVKVIVSQWKIGDLVDFSVLMGLLICELQCVRVEYFIVSGCDVGVILVCGGGCLVGLDQGFFSEIMLFDDVCNDMVIVQEEIFGLVGVIIGFDMDDEVIVIVNDFCYGLNGGIFSVDVVIVYWMVWCICVGSVYFNGGGGGLFYVLIGGYKCLGIGCEFGFDWLKEFSQEKFIIYLIGC